MKRIALALSCLLALAPAAHAGGKCKVGRYGVLPVTMEGMNAVVTGRINGEPVRLMADSGAFFSMLKGDTARRLGLRLDPLPEGLSVSGVGGEERARVATVREFTLDGFGNGQPFKRIEFIVGGNAFAGTVDGILGQNVLGVADIEYDLANGHVALLKSEGCRNANLAYWADGASVGEFSFEPISPAEPHLIVKVRLNGRTIDALLDSGASFSILTLDAARRIGFSPDDPKVHPGGLVSGIGSRLAESWIARFDELDLGGELIRNAQLRVAKFDLPVDADMLLGADFFLSHHLYVARDQHRVYFTFNGGHVFDLRRHDGQGDDAPVEAAAAPAGAAPAASSAAAARPPDPAELEAAAALRRRASAESARGELRAAKADLDEAIRKDPASAEGYFQRVAVALGLGDAVPAGKDLDQAIERDPKLVEARMMRGLMRLQAKEAAGAEADFAAAIAAAPADSGIALRVALSEIHYGDPAQGRARLDAWIAAHGDDTRLAEALNERCWERAKAGVELDQALDDCNKAIRHSNRNSAYLDSRGLVWLRKGKYENAIDDYAQSVKQQAKGASSLYGLGLAELRAGRREKGEAHLAAAKALDNGVADRYAGMGLQP